MLLFPPLRSTVVVPIYCPAAVLFRAQDSEIVGDRDRAVVIEIWTSLPHSASASSTSDGAWASLPLALLGLDASRLAHSAAGSRTPSPSTPAASGGTVAAGAAFFPLRPGVFGSTLRLGRGADPSAQFVGGSPGTGWQWCGGRGEDTVYEVVLPPGLHRLMPSPGPNVDAPIARLARLTAAGARLLGPVGTSRRGMAARARLTRLLDAGFSVTSTAPRTAMDVIRSTPGRASTVIVAPECSAPPTPAAEGGEGGLPSLLAPKGSTASLGGGQDVSSFLPHAASNAEPPACADAGEVAYVAALLHVLITSTMANAHHSSEGERAGASGEARGSPLKRFEVGQPGFTSALLDILLVLPLLRTHTFRCKVVGRLLGLGLGSAPGSAGALLEDIGRLPLPLLLRCAPNARVQLQAARARQALELQEALEQEKGTGSAGRETRRSRASTLVRSTSLLERMEESSTTSRTGSSPVLPLPPVLCVSPRRLSYAACALAGGGNSPRSASGRSARARSPESTGRPALGGGGQSGSDSFVGIEEDSGTESEASAASGDGQQGDRGFFGSVRRLGGSLLSRLARRGKSDKTSSSLPSLPCLLVKEVPAVAEEWLTPPPRSPRDEAASEEVLTPAKMLPYEAALLTLGKWASGGHWEAADSAATGLQVLALDLFINALVVITPALVHPALVAHILYGLCSSPTGSVVRSYYSRALRALFGKGSPTLNSALLAAPSGSLPIPNLAKSIVIGIHDLLYAHMGDVADAAEHARVSELAPLPPTSAGHTMLPAVTTPRGVSTPAVAMLKHTGDVAHAFQSGGDASPVRPSPVQADVVAEGSLAFALDVRPAVTGGGPFKSYSPASPACAERGTPSRPTVRGSGVLSSARIPPHAPMRDLTNVTAFPCRVLPVLTPTRELNAILKAEVNSGAEAGAGAPGPDAAAHADSVADAKRLDALRASFRASGGASRRLRSPPGVSSPSQHDIEVESLTFQRSSHNLLRGGPKFDSPTPTAVLSTPPASPVLLQSPLSPAPSSPLLPAHLLDTTRSDTGFDLTILMGLVADLLHESQAVAASRGALAKAEAAARSGGGLRLQRSSAVRAELDAAIASPSPETPLSARRGRKASRTLIGVSPDTRPDGSASPQRASPATSPSPTSRAGVSHVTASPPARSAAARSASASSRASTEIEDVKGHGPARPSSCTPALSCASDCGKCAVQTSTLSVTARGTLYGSMDLAEAGAGSDVERADSPTRAGGRFVAPPSPPSVVQCPAADRGGVGLSLWLEAARAAATVAVRLSSVPDGGDTISPEYRAVLTVCQMMSASCPLLREVVLRRILRRWPSGLSDNEVVLLDFLGVVLGSVHGRNDLAVSGLRGMLTSRITRCLRSQHIKVARAALILVNPTTSKCDALFGDDPVALGAVISALQDNANHWSALVQRASSLALAIFMGQLRAACVSTGVDEARVLKPRPHLHLPEYGGGRGSPQPIPHSVGV